MFTYKFLEKILFSIMVLVTLSFFVSFSGCSSGGNLPPEVCTYGNVVCDVSGYLCENVPQIPPEVCTLVNLACVNLSILCDTDPESQEYKAALTSLGAINSKLSNVVAKMREKTTPQSQ